MGKGEQTRQAILKHALRMCSSEGLNGISLGRLAKELKMSKSGLFAHFKSKEVLQLQVLEYAADEFLDAVVRPAFTAPEGEPRMRKLFEYWIEWTRNTCYAGGCPFVQFSFELDDQPGPLLEDLQRQQRGWIQLLAEAARRAIKKGHFRNDLDPEQFAYDLNAIVLGYHYASRLIRDESAESRVKKSFEDLIEKAKE